MDSVTSESVVVGCGVGLFVIGIMGGGLLNRLTYFTVFVCDYDEEFVTNKKGMMHEIAWQGKCQKQMSLQEDIVHDSEKGGCINLTE